MIDITLHFNTAEEAIIALAKIKGGAAAKAAVAPVAPAAPAEQPAATKPRKPRADAGKPRGPYKNADAAGNIESENRSTLESASNGSAAIAPSVDSVSPSASAPEPAAPAPAEADNAQPSGSAPVTAGPATLEDAQAALTKLFETKGLATAQEVLGAFGVKRLKELEPEKRAAFIANAQAAL